MTTIEEINNLAKEISVKSEKLEIEFNALQNRLYAIAEEQRELQYDWYNAIDEDWEKFKDLDDPFDRWLPNEFSC